MAYPAHAGIDLFHYRLYLPYESLPRTRGDRPRSRERQVERYRPTPHTRGSTRIRWGLGCWIVAYPAHAGIDLNPTVFIFEAVSLPRTRGDRPYRYLHIAHSRMPTPHTRGSTQEIRALRRSGSAYPAHAGIDPIPAIIHEPHTSLPRTRGDRPGPGKYCEITGTPTPHTRGSTP